MNQLQTPLFDAMSAFYKKKSISLHVPGHKNGRVFSEKGQALYNPLLGIDATELSGLDDLHAPEGAILEAEQLLADLYGVKKSYFLVNGSTVGNMAMILAACREGDKVLVQRNCHKSILHGLMLANVQPIFLQPAFYEDWGIAGGVGPKLIEEALCVHPEAKAIVLTYPNYYGLGEDLSEMVELAHRRGIPVLVDEAHGAHFQLGDPFPNTAILAGADAVVHSAHKTLPAMTMGSYLHLQSAYIDADQVSFYLQMLQSSSPSYPIMGSLDLARAYLASFTSADKNELIRKITKFRGELEALDSIKVLEAPTGTLCDPLKVVISSTNGLSGFELQQLCEAKGIYTELADPHNLLLILPLMKMDADYPFYEIIQHIKNATYGRTGNVETIQAESWLAGRSMTGLGMPYGLMKQIKPKLVDIRKAIGKVSAEMVIPYPPGIPLIMSGEMITAEHISSLKGLLAHGARFHGGSSLSTGELIVYESGQSG
ncbi:aminotransferase class I/II-fold pyridoxal phosphate-dependent enzyme [Peribacillus muralis]|uniref:aminotransferase class I/II-fold pyridoxal phosphate-dependent enzyme n=1 Tax=Peribacillus muralis TaxID=264697 RepID=UPI001F4DB296|nr:aminotransferase class I/II-fold pyridoxal phosphate-dependent enzyme [Peribacillus muralis]MCK1995383.1 aminotransferase class I/II-fold pyridoxal phosphate-dependent enzyme [Peribacillus muralis]MCK2015966.1 aminotransferase class I/II-fold pyridoxal phosphate-dependent enzyme [Peribacillus muralis]